MEKGLQIAHTRKAEMSRGQSLLLKTMIDLVKKGETLQMDDVVIAYYLGVKKTLFWVNYENYHGTMCATGPHKEYDILVEYHKNSYIWRSKISSLIKSWFVSAIGLLVIKGWLRVLPIIEIE